MSQYTLKHYSGLFVVFVIGIRIKHRAQNENIINTLLSSYTQKDVHMLTVYVVYFTFTTLKCYPSGMMEYLFQKVSVLFNRLIPEEQGTTERNA